MLMVASGRKGRSGAVYGLGLTKHEIAFHNTSASASTGLVRFGVAFEDGDVPSGQTARVRIKGGENVRSHAIETTTYASGALRKATMVADIGTVTGSGSTTIEVYNAAGSVAASSFNASSWVSGSSDDLVCEIRSRTGSSSGALGNLDTSLKTAFGTSSRIFTVANCDLFYRVWVWEKLSGEEHLTPIIHASWWLDTDGSTVKALELVPVLSQHWWVDDPFSTQQTKELQTYDATWKWGATTLDSRSSLAHAYHTQWASLRSADDAQHACPHWIDLGSTAMPTLRKVYALPSLQKCAKSWIIPPLNFTLTPSADSFPTDYTPLGVNGMSAVINATGDHSERGLMPRQMANALMDQTETAWRKARVGSQAGLTLYSHVRDHRSASTLSDTSMGLIPGVFSQLGAKTYDDLGTETSRGRITNGALTYDSPVGGTGTMSSYDDAHAGNYAGLMAFVDGERYLLDAALDAADFAISQSHWNEYVHNGWLLYYEFTARRSALSIPSTQYGTLHPVYGQERMWSPNIISWAYALCPDSDRHKPYLLNLITNIATYYDDVINGTGSYSGYPSGQVAYGHLNGSSTVIGSAWMGNFSAQGFMFLAQQLANGTEKTALLTTAGQCFRVSARMITNKQFMHLNSYRYLAYPIQNDYLTFLPTDGAWQIADATINTSTDVITLNNSLLTGYSLTDGDKLYFTYRSSGLSDVGVPSEVSENTVYYVQQSSGSSFKISTDVGGASIVDFTTSTVCSFGITISDYNDKYSVIGSSSSYLPPSDSYMSIARATMHMAWAVGNPDIVEQDFIDADTWMDGLDHSSFTPWAMDGTTVRPTA